MSVSEIVQDLKVPRRTVYNIRKRPGVCGTTERKPGSARPISVAILDFVNKIKMRIQTNPAKTVKSMAQDLGVSDFSIDLIVRKAVKEAGAQSLVRTKRFMFTEKLKAPRLLKCKKIRSILKKKTPTVLFSDEK